MVCYGMHAEGWWTTLSIRRKRSGSRNEGNTSFQPALRSNEVAAGGGSL